MNALQVLDSGLVRRWHTSPQMSITGQNNAAHSWGVCVLAEALAPELVTKEFLIHALLHDCGERKTCDMSSDAKSRMPELSAILKKAEAEAITSLGISLPHLTQDQKKLLKLCDLLEASILIINFALRPREVEGWERCIDMIGELSCHLDGLCDEPKIWWWIDTHINPLLIDRKIVNQYDEQLQIIPF